MSTPIFYVFLSFKHVKRDCIGWSLSLFVVKFNIFMLYFDSHHSGTSGMLLPPKGHMSEVLRDTFPVTPTSSAPISGCTHPLSPTQGTPASRSLLFVYYGNCVVEIPWKFLYLNTKAHKITKRHRFMKGVIIPNLFLTFQLSWLYLLWNDV